MSRRLFCTYLGCFLFILIILDGRPVKAQEPIRLELDVQQTGATISPLLFGHNLEHTRRAITQGLSAEMLANRKFAGVEKGLPKRWTVSGQVAIDDQVPYAGRYSLRLENHDAVGSRVSQHNPWLAFRQGTKYAFRIWVKCDAPQSLEMCITEPETSRRVCAQATQIPPGDWQLWSGEFVAPATVERASFELGGKTPGVCWIGAVSLQPADTFHGMRRDVVTLLKQIKPGCLRWPGGCYAEFYRWQEGLLPVDQRPSLGPTGLPFLLPENDDFDPQELGIDEFLALCREVGCQPALTVRVSENTPEDGAAWVEYCNGSAETHWGRVRAQRGHAEPYGVKYWFVGNELIAFGRGECRTPQGCGTQSRLFATAMKKVDPSIELTGCSWVGNEPWNHALIAGAGDVLDHYSAHNYLLDTYRGDPLEIPRMTTVRLRPLLAEMHASLLRGMPAGKAAPMTFDEWNTMWGQSGSVGMGLYAAGVLQLLCREAESLGVVRANYFMPINEGAIRVTPFDARLDTAGEVFDLLQVHQGNRVLKTPAWDAVADLDVCASVTPDGSRVWVTLVNRHSSAARPVELVLRSGLAPREAPVRLLVPQTPSVDQRQFHRRDEMLAVENGSRVVVIVPAYGIARVELGPRSK